MWGRNWPFARIPLTRGDRSVVEEVGSETRTKTFESMSIPSARRLASAQRERRISSSKRLTECARGRAVTLKPTKRRKVSEWKTKGSVDSVGLDPVASVSNFDFEVIEHVEDLT